MVTLKLDGRKTGGKRLAAATEPLESRVLLSAYFVAATGGSDANPGTLAKPFATIQHAADLAKAGDSVYLRGGTYRETVHPLQSGTAAAPITFTAYNNENVKIDGADPITGWTNYQGSIYSASMPWTFGDGNDQIFQDTKMLTEARWPNTGLDVEHPTVATIDSVTATVNATGLSTATIHSAALQDPAGTWVGATIHVSPGQGWVYQTGTVTDYSPGVLTYQYQQLTSYEVPAAKNRFFLTGKFQGLNAAAEWYRDPTSGLLYLRTIGSDNPAAHQIEAKHRMFAFDLSGNSYIKVQNIHLFACTINTDNSSTHDTISSIAAAFVSHQMDIAFPWNSKYVPHSTGIIINGSFNVVDHSSIAYSSGDGVFLGGSNNTVSNCTISEADYAVGDEAGITIQGTNNTAIHNTIFDTGRSGITHIFSTKDHILNNLIHDIGVQSTDSGGVYSWHTDGQGTEIAYNTIYNALSGGFGNTGLFLDDMSSDMVLHNNLVYNANNALKMNPPANDNNLILNNTLVGTNFSISAGRNADMTGSIFMNNIFTARIIIGTGAILHNNISLSVANVHFTNPSANDYTLAPNSPAIDAGLVHSPYTDGYTGAAPDAGAFERGVPAFSSGVPAPTVPTRSAKSVIQAETYNAQSGVTFQGPGIGSCDNGDWVKYSAVDFGAGVTKFIASLAVPAQYAGGQIQVRLDSTAGPLVATLTTTSTGSWNTYVKQSATVAGAKGVHDLYLVFKGGFGVCNLDWLQFS